MEVIPSTGGGSGAMPFQRHNVEEWSRLDSLTGMLEHARVESGHWAASTSNSSQQYGKVVDSRTRNLADGSVQQRQRKQLEVFQAQVPGGSLQVIRTKSVTSTNSSSTSWRAPLHSDINLPSEFENLQLPVNPLDISSQKTKASIGRSGSIGSRRPPSRPRSITNKVDSVISEENLLPNAEKKDVDQRLSDVSRICQKIHEEAKRSMSNSFPCSVPEPSSKLTSLNDNKVIRTENINRKDSTDGNRYSCIKSDKQNSFNAFDAFVDKTKKPGEIVSNGLVHAIITRNKSCSTEDLKNNDYNEKERLNEGKESSVDLIRTLGVRRSFQLPNRGYNSDIPSGDISKLHQELEDKKILDTMKNNTTNFEAFENVYRYGTVSARNTSMFSGNNRQACIVNSLTDKSGNGSELEGFSMRVDSTKGSPHKRHSFVTVESLKEVRGRLRHLSTPPADVIQLPNSSKCEKRYVEDSDDGIVTEDFNKTVSGMNLGSTEEIQTSRVKSYVYDMEAIANEQSSTHKSTAGTGSLELNRSSSSSGNRSEEWYNRRKSYGFEQVHNQQADNHSQPVTFQERSRVESSTDSGICRSSETVIPSSWTSFNREKANDKICHNNFKANHSIKIKQDSDDRRFIETENRGNESNSQKGRKIVVTLGSDNEGIRGGMHVNGSSIMESSPTIVSNSWRSGYDAKALNILTTGTSNRSSHRLTDPLTVTIPIVPDDSFSSIDGSVFTDARKRYLKQFPEKANVSIENGWRNSGTFITSRNECLQKNLSDESKTLAARRELILKHSGGNGWSAASRQTDSEIKRHSIAVDESKYVKKDLKCYNIYDNRTEHFNFENGFKTSSTGIPDVEKDTGLNPSNKEEALPLQKEMCNKIQTSTGMSQDGNDSKPAPLAFENDYGDELLLQNHLAGKKHKKVEFCKTEVHFAAEPGRFNIVETDEKPPPNNIRRRRRTSSGTILVTPHLQDANRISLPEIRFGDSPYEKKLLGGTESKNNSHQIAVSVDPFNKSDLNQSEPITPASGSPSGFQDDADKDDNIFTLANATIPSTMGQDTLEMGVHNTDEDVCSDSNSLQPNSLGSISLCNMMPRSILKNNKKPRPFHLGETDEDILMSSVSEKSERSNEDAEVKWGVRLKPVQSRESPAPSTSSWRSTVTLHNPKSDAQRQQNYTPALILKDVRLSSPQSYEEATHLSKPLKSLQPSFQKMPAVGALGAPIVPKTPSTDSVGTGMELKISMGLPLSVAERVRRVEDLQHAALETRGYSTRVNFGAGETTVIESRSSNEQQTQSTPASPKYQPNNRPKPVWLQREERRQEAMQHCDIRSQTASDKGLVVHICKNDGSSHEDGHGSLHSSMNPEDYSRTEDINGRNAKRTTTIFIDLSPDSSDNHVTKVGLVQNEMLKISGNEECSKSTGTLRSPSLIMKTINNSSQAQEQEENKGENSNQHMQGKKGITSNSINTQTGAPVAAPRTNKMYIQSQNFTNRCRSNLCAKSEENNINSKLFVKRPCINSQGEDDRNTEILEASSQLAALKELYYSTELSDDSERADEEVRSYMSGGGDEDDRDQDEESSSVVSGSWSRMRAFRNIHHHFHKFNTGHKDHADGSPMLKLDSSKEPSLQRSVTEAMLPSYNNSGRLREVETLVSTHSGHPKITSISLRYEGEQDNDQLPKVCDRNPDCDRHQATFHSLPSSKKGSLYTTEFKHPTDFEGNLSSTTVSNKSYKSLFSQPNGNSNSSKSLFTQKQKRLSPSFVESPFQPERETSQFKTSEKDYENLNPKSTTRNNCDPLDTDRTMFLLGRKVRHPETNEFFSKGSGKQESGPTAPSDKRLSNNRRSLSPVMNKMGHKVQEKKQFHSSVLTEHRACGSGNSSDAIRSIRNENEDIKKERLNITEEETKKGSCFHSKTLSNENHKPLEGSEERTKISDHYSNREKRHSQMKSTCSISTKRDRSLSPSEIVHPHTGLPGNKLTMSPLYENLRMLAVEPTAKSNSQNVMSDTVETESAILEELTRAADQILQAVNGYTDEESYKASSDEPDDEIVKDGRKRRGNRCGKVRRPSVSLGTITEGASSKKHQETGNSTSELYTHKSTASGRKSHQRLTKTRLLPTSSTSSVESLTREIPQVQTRALLKQKGTSSINNCNKSRVSSSSTSSTAVKPSCRTVRLLQRASSRELLLQTYASSSEDVASGVEGGNNRKPMVPRRTKIHNTSNNKTDHAKTNLKKNTISPDSHPSPSATAQPRKREADINKPRERFPGSTNKAVPLARKVNGDGSGSPSGVKHHTSRTREDERHQRGSNRPTTRRDNTDLRHRAQGGGTTTLEPGGCDKKERAVIYERHVMGTMGGVNRSSASCTVYVPAKQHCPCICS
ncbi:uncharacterized protein LOC111870354 isoform X2 [Cryptotermes secundus]|uniref:uncharacterized protein LOC111870354 isoform X2 n=1 Tax=Cryptotermes secundus TaxID=105785 RepID=UPI000CD7D5F7|nr:uncharacterized protein LOC111870354 isoform X2 [Cryptotermes secundus]